MVYPNGGGIWKADDHDAGDDILQHLERIYSEADDQDFPPVVLPPLTHTSLSRAALRFRSDTAVGVDAVRPRHFARLTSGALEALAKLLMLFERRRRWTSIAREVIEVARGKKSGGARLVGLGASLYRLWARARFEDIRSTMESRVERAFLPAAPGKGSLRAVYDMTLTVEAARARGLVAATTGYDLKQYYEFIDIAEIALGGRQFGLPIEITALLVHLYTGPRRIRVCQAVSVAKYPRRSILAGCSFALLIIRLITIRPVERLLHVIEPRFKEWDACCHPTFYVDDGVVTTIGTLEAVSFLHGWVTRLILAWVRDVLKKGIAHHKTMVVVSCPELRRRITGDMAKLDISVRLGGEMLGVDYTAGGPLRRRPTQVARRRKAVARRGRVAWLRRMGGIARKVARQGVIPELTYGSEVVGLPPPALRDARAVAAASAGVTSSGASLTARLALGGDAYSEHDPFVLHHNQPLRILLQQVWDIPRKREDFVRAWYRARDTILNDDGVINWGQVNGPVSAAYAHLARIGAKWPKAFTVTALGSNIDLLKVPPRTVMRILTTQARRHVDHLLLRRLAAMHSWDVEGILTTYRYGIHWELLRQALRGKRGELSGKERRLLQVVASGAFWPEERRWRCGLLESPVCVACGMAVGTPGHRLHDCGAFDSERALRRAAGESFRLPAEASHPGLAPLLLMGLPPYPLDWQEEEMVVVEGEMPLIMDGTLYGDGTGHNQNIISCRTAAWSLVRLDDTSPMTTTPAAILRGTVGGWEQTVPRAELTALIAFLRHSVTGVRYVGDCRYVLEGAECGVRPFLMSSAAADPDLWRVIDLLVRDRGAPPTLSKVKAHRSRTRALQDGTEALVDWQGNDQADIAAKSFDKRRIALDTRSDVWEASEDISLRTLVGVAKGAAMAVTRWPQNPQDSRRPGKKTGGGPRTETIADTDDGHIIRRDEAGRFECVICRRVAYTAAGARRMGTTTCGGAISDAVHQTHQICRSQGLIWCKSCGAYSSRWPRQLVSACPQRPRSQAQRNVLRRLTQGLAPTTAQYLGGVAEASGLPSGTVDRVQHITNGNPAEDERHRGDPRPRGLHHPAAAPRPGAGPRPALLRLPRVGPRRHGGSLSPVAPRDRDAPRPHSLEPVGSESSRRERADNWHGYARLGKGRDHDDGRPSYDDHPVPLPVATVAGPTDGKQARFSHQAGVGDRCDRAPSQGHWSSAVAVGGPKSLTDCTSCGGRTRLRCSACVRGLCLACAKADKVCQWAVAEQTCFKEAHVHQSVEPTISPSVPRRRLRGKQGGALRADVQSHQPHHPSAHAVSTPSVSNGGEPAGQRDHHDRAQHSHGSTFSDAQGASWHAPAGRSPHGYHQHHHLRHSADLGEAGSVNSSHAAIPLAAPLNADQAVHESQVPTPEALPRGCHHQRHHHHGSPAEVTARVAVVADNAADSSHVPALAGMSGGRPHHHPHHGGPLASIAVSSHHGQFIHDQADDQTSKSSTLHEDWARQHNVGVASSLTSSVLPLSQGCLVDVAACAADLSHGPGPPQQRTKHRSGSVAESLSLSPTASSSAAAAPWSVSRAQQ